MNWNELPYKWWLRLREIWGKPAKIPNQNQTTRFRQFFVVDFVVNIGVLNDYIQFSFFHCVCLVQMQHFIHFPEDIVTKHTISPDHNSYISSSKENTIKNMHFHQVYSALQLFHHTNLFFWLGTKLTIW